MTEAYGLVDYGSSSEDEEIKSTDHEAAVALESKNTTKCGLPSAKDLLDVNSPVAKSSKVTIVDGNKTKEFVLPSISDLLDVNIPLTSSLRTQKVIHCNRVTSKSGNLVESSKKLSVSKHPEEVKILIPAHVSMKRPNISTEDVNSWTAASRRKTKIASETL